MIQMPTKTIVEKRYVLDWTDQQSEQFVLEGGFVTKSKVRVPIQCPNMISQNGQGVWHREGLGFSKWFRWGSLIGGREVFAIKGEG